MNLLVLIPKVRLKGSKVIQDRLNTKRNREIIMKIADILRTIADNLHNMENNSDTDNTGAEQGMVATPVLINRGLSFDKTDRDSSGKTPSGNAKPPEDLFLPPLQQKQELLKKAVGVENVYDDGNPVEQEQDDSMDDSEDDAETNEPKQDELSRIKQLAGVPVAAVQELSDDEVFDG